MTGDRARRRAGRRGTREDGGSGRRDVVLDRGDAGVRIDLVLLRHLSHEPGVSRARIQKWIGAGRVEVNGASVSKPATRVAADDRVQVDVREIRTRARPRAEALPLDVLFEDAHLLAVNKAAGMVVHPSYRHVGGTLINALLHAAARWPSGEQPMLLTRLDKMTSGVLLVAKRREVIARLQHEMRAQRIEKDYLAVVHGRPTPRQGTIDLSLDRDPWDRRRVTVTDRGGQRAVTSYGRLAVADSDGGPCSLVRCRLVTGRMHQIRVHLAAKGWPLLGDPVYGTPGATPPFHRQALHAHRVAFTHPITAERLEIVAPWPEDLRELVERLFGRVAVS